MLCARQFATQFARPFVNSSKWNTLASVKKIGTSSSLNNAQPATGNTEEDKIYELRIYSVKPKKVREFLALTSEEFHLRTAHSKLFGYWTSEIGGLNQVVHIWEYDSLSHRATVRANLASDTNWSSRYLSRVIGMWVNQTNSAMTLLPGTGIDLPTGKGVYELQTLTLNGSPVTWSKALTGYVEACKGIENGPSKMVGAWQSVLGPRQTTTLLWQHPGPDSCVSLHRATNALEESTVLSSHVADGHSRLLLPHAVSPLQ